MKWKLKRKLSVVMSAALVLSGLNTGPVMAAVDETEKTIIRFEELEEKVALQELPVGAEEGDIKFPSSLWAYIEVQKVEKTDSDEFRAYSVSDVIPFTENTDGGENAAEEAGQEEDAEQGNESPGVGNDAEEDKEASSKTEEVQEDEIQDKSESFDEETAETEDSESGEIEETEQVDEIIEESEPEHNSQEEDKKENLSDKRAGEKEESLSDKEVRTATPSQAGESNKNDANDPEIKTVRKKIENIDWELNFAESTDSQFHSEEEGTYVYEPVIPDEYDMDLDVELPQITVVIKAADGEKEATVLTAEAGDYRITVTADAGVFPEGVSLSAALIEDEESIEEFAGSVQDAAGETPDELVVFDITILDEENQEVQPNPEKGKVVVSFENLKKDRSAPDADGEQQIYHMDEEKGQVELLDTTVKDNVVEAETTHFSTFAVVLLEKGANGGSDELEASTGLLTITSGSTTGDAYYDTEGWKWDGSTLTLKTPANGPQQVKSVNFDSSVTGATVKLDSNVTLDASTISDDQPQPAIQCQIPSSTSLTIDATGHTLTVKTNGTTSAIFTFGGAIAFTGGTVVSNSSVNSVAGNVDITGGNVSATSSSGNAISAGGVVTISGNAQIIATSAVGSGISGENGIYITGGTVTATTKKSDSKVFALATNLESDGDTQAVSISGGTVNLVNETDGKRMITAHRLSVTNGAKLTFNGQPAFTIAGVSPASGFKKGGTAVNVTGTNLTGVTGVKLMRGADYEEQTARNAAGLQTAAGCLTFTTPELGDDYTGPASVQFADANGAVRLTNVFTYTDTPDPIATVTNVAVTPNSANVQKGTTRQFNAVVTGTGSFARTVKWTVTGGALGTSIDSTGLLTVAAGETAKTLTVTATSTVDGSKSGTATVTVTTEPVTKYQLTVTDGTGSGEYEAGTNITITANKPQTGKIFDKWTDNGGGSFASETAATTTYTMPGNAATVTATYKDAPAGTITVTGVTLNRNTMSLYSNTTLNTATLTATVSPADATNKAVSWSSGNTEAVTVDGNGNVRAVGNGTAVITATTADGGHTATCTVTVSTYSGGSSGGGSSSGGSSGGNSSSGNNSQSAGTTTTDAKKGQINSVTGIITGSGSGQSNWQSETKADGTTSWKLQYADGTTAAGTIVTAADGTTYEQPAWEMVNGAWYPFGADGYAKSGMVFDPALGGYFYIDINTGMKTGWQEIDGKWYYFNPNSDGKKGIMFMNGKTPDGYYIKEDGTWDGEAKKE
ncbi:Ig-like domain-containing protein [Clostridium transplantifaecale]|uniref:Ig-like domain-containing protein n=1 Tax=Clostridium transplantifaecale TaxID=2479838 RepID=UPI000F635C07|nr:Ig-like domain-containing protein [Clostridium transplantifaecale]